MGECGAERVLVKNMGNPPVWEAALTKFYDALDETMTSELRKDIFARFFAVAPSGLFYLYHFSPWFKVF